MADRGQAVNPETGKHDGREKPTGKMAGRRMLHRNICKSRKLHQVSAEAERTWTRLLPCVDDNGNFEFDAALIKSTLFPLSAEIAIADVERWLRELIDVRNGQDKMGLLAEYVNGTHRYIHFVGFENFQKLRNDRNPHVDCPPHPETLGPVRFPLLAGMAADSMAATSGMPSDIPLPYRGMAEVEVKRSKEKKAHPAVAPARDFAFKAFEGRFGQKPNWTVKDFVQLADLFKRRPELTLAEFARRWKFYMASTDPFLAKRGFSLAYFCANFDSFLSGPVQGKPGGEKKSAAQQAREDEQQRGRVSPEGRKTLERFK